MKRKAGDLFDNFVKINCGLTTVRVITLNRTKMIQTLF